MASRNPNPAYDNQIVYGDKELYARVGRIAEEEAGKGKRLAEKFEIPIRSGKAWVVKKGVCSAQVSELAVNGVEVHQVTTAISLFSFRFDVSAL